MKYVATSIIIAIALFFGGPVNAQSKEPYILIQEPLVGSVFDNQSDVTLAGTATPNSTITLITEEGEYDSLSSSQDGTWSYTIPTVSEGATTIQARVDVELDELSSKSAIANVTYIVKPPASSSARVGQLAQTGMITAIAVLAGTLMLSLTIWTIIDYRRHKRPLEEANKTIKYSFWHHLKVVSIPLLRYRLAINLYKRSESKSERVRRY